MIDIAKLPPGVSVGGDESSGPIIQIASNACTARVSLRGGHLLDWQPTGHAPVIWLSPGAVFQDGKAIRGGVPVCWPWFADHPKHTAKPSHGFARVRDWQVESIDDMPEGIRMALMLMPEERDGALWPHQSRPQLEITAGERLRISVKNTNVDDVPIRLTQALHTYFAVDDIEDVALHGLEARTYYDKLTGASGLVQHGAIAFAGEVDRIYQHGIGDIRIGDSGNERTITVSQTGGESVVVWNPWIEKTQRLGDMGPDDSFRSMVCVETGSVGDQTIEIAPGASHTLTTEISVSRPTS